MFGGNLNTALSLSDNTVSTSSANSLGLNSYRQFQPPFRRVGRGSMWQLFAECSHAIGHLRDLLLQLWWKSAAPLGKIWLERGAAVSKTLLTELAGSSNSSQSFTTAINYTHWITANGSYAKSNGTAIQAGLGLIQNPVPQPIVPEDDLILFGGKSYSVGLSSNPMRRLTFGASYSKSISNTTLQGTMSANNNKQINAIFNYQFRKMYLTGGYSNLVQSFSASGLPPENISSFYMGVTRWFNFF